MQQSLATAYDELHPTAHDLSEALRDAVLSLTGPFPPAVLDIGCGTGRVLDLGLTAPDRYAGVDPSQPMLNQLVRKHPSVAAVYPMPIEEALAQRLFTHGQFEIVTLLFNEDEEFAASVPAAFSAIASRGVITMNGNAVSVADTRKRRSGLSAI